VEWSHWESFGVRPCVGVISRSTISPSRGRHTLSTSSILKSFRAVSWSHTLPFPLVWSNAFLRLSESSSNSLSFSLFSTSSRTEPSCFSVSSTGGEFGRALLLGPGEVKGDVKLRLAEGGARREIDPRRLDVVVDKIDALRSRFGVLRPATNMSGWG
jgi:hypothetical protein